MNCEISNCGSGIEAAGAPVPLFRPSRRSLEAPPVGPRAPFAEWTSMRRAKTSIDDARGFTLLELTVVVALIGIVMLFALPRVDAMMAGRSAARVSRRIGLVCRQLRADAVRLQKPHRLIIDFDAQRITWRQDATDPPEAPQTGGKGISLSGPVRLLDVIDASGRKTMDGKAAIRFYPAGYADLALIHLRDGDARTVSLRIEPFLPHCLQAEGYLGIDDRMAEHGS